VATRELEGRQQPRLVKRGQTAHGLELEDDLVLDQDVEAIPWGGSHPQRRYQAVVGSFSSQPMTRRAAFSDPWELG